MYRKREQIRRVVDTLAVTKVYNQIYSRSVKETELEKKLQAACVTLASRERLDEAMDLEFGVDRRAWELNAEAGNIECPEVVIGSGIHAAIYCATKAKMDGEAPLVFESMGRPGGQFALAERPVFFLNSRNRPEVPVPSAPRTRGPLNRIPNGILQAADLSFSEYQTNVELAFLARIHLALCAKTVSGIQVGSVEKQETGEYRLFDSVGNCLAETPRVIVATGLGDPVENIRMPEKDGRILNFQEFVATMGDKKDQFPLDGWKRVAIVGPNDSANVTAEYLLGQGPQPGYCTTEQYGVTNVTWIGQSCLNKEGFEEGSRSRYAGLGRFFPREAENGEGYSQIIPAPGRALSADLVDDGVRLRWTNAFTGRPKRDVFDHVVLCTGFEDKINTIFGDIDINTVQEPVNLEEEVIAAKFQGEEIYKIGPCANLKVEGAEEEKLLVNIPANSASLFRYGSKTAKLAVMLAQQERTNGPL